MPGVAGRLTIGLCAQSCANLARLLKVNVPARLLAGAVLQGECVNAVALLDGILTVGIGSVESGVDGVEGGRGREFVCCPLDPTMCDSATS